MTTSGLWGCGGVEWVCEHVGMVEGGPTLLCNGLACAKLLWK